MKLIILVFSCILAFCILSIVPSRELTYVSHVVHAEEIATSTVPAPKPAKTVYVEPPIEIDIIIRAKAHEYAVDPGLAEKIAFCESRWSVKATNHNLNGTTDGGLFQINSVHSSDLKKLGLDPYEIIDNVEYAMILLSRNGTSDFVASKNCWSSL